MKAFLAGIMLLIAGCTPAAKAPAVDSRALARASVLLLKDAWNVATRTCVDTAVAQNSDTIRARCETVLTPARNMLIAAADGVDLWTEADQRNLPCLISSAAADMGQVANITGVVVPQVVKDGLSLAQTYAGKCAP